jgi:hypothetical protein
MAMAYVMTRCFVDAAGDFAKYEQIRYDDESCLGGVLEVSNTSAPGCQYSGDSFPSDYRCDSSASSAEAPWSNLPPALVSL